MVMDLHVKGDVQYGCSFLGQISIFYIGSSSGLIVQNTIKPTKKKKTAT